MAQSGIVNNVTHNSLLHVACKENREKIVEILLQHGADANITDNRQKATFTAMHWAVWKKNLNIMKLLIKYKFNCRKYINNIMSKREPYNLMSVFLVLCSNGSVECMECLYSKFGELIQIEVKDRRGRNGVFLAIVNKHLDMLEYLFKNVYIDERLRKRMLNAVSHNDSVPVKSRIYSTLFAFCVI